MFSMHMYMHNFYIREDDCGIRGFYPHMCRWQRPYEEPTWEVIVYDRTWSDSLLTYWEVNYIAFASEDDEDFQVFSSRVITR